MSVHTLCPEPRRRSRRSSPPSGGSCTSPTTPLGRRPMLQPNWWGWESRPDPAQVVTSAQAGAALAARQIPPDLRCWLSEDPGRRRSGRTRLRGHRRGSGRTCRVRGRRVAAVVRVSVATSGGRPWRERPSPWHAGCPGSPPTPIWTIPVSEGIAPGNGTLINAVSAATGRLPEVAGKPFPPLLLQAADLAQGLRPLVVGDRLDTDIEGAQNAAMTSLLVLSGVSGRWICGGRPVRAGLTTWPAICQDCWPHRSPCRWRMAGRRRVTRRCAGAVRCWRSRSTRTPSGRVGGGPPALAVRQ